MPRIKLDRSLSSPILSTAAAKTKPNIDLIDFFRPKLNNAKSNQQKKAAQQQQQQQQPVKPKARRVESFFKQPFDEQNSSPAPDVNVGQRVAYKQYYGHEFGTIRWIGRVPQICAGWTVGVEFDNAIGEGDGSLEGRRYFIAKDCFAKFLALTSVQVVDQHVGRPEPGTMISVMSAAVRPGQMISIQRVSTVHVEHCFLNAPHRRAGDYLLAVNTRLHCQCPNCGPCAHIVMPPRVQRLGPSKNATHMCQFSHYSCCQTEISCSSAPAPRPFDQNSPPPPPPVGQSWIAGAGYLSQLTQQQAKLMPDDYLLGLGPNDDPRALASLSRKNSRRSSSGRGGHRSNLPIPDVTFENANVDYDSLKDSQIGSSDSDSYTATATDDRLDSSLEADLDSLSLARYGVARGRGSASRRQNPKIKQRRQQQRQQRRGSNLRTLLRSLVRLCLNSRINGPAFGAGIRGNAHDYPKPQLGNEKSHSDYTQSDLNSLDYFDANAFAVETAGPAFVQALEGVATAAAAAHSDLNCLYVYGDDNAVGQTLPVAASDSTSTSSAFASDGAQSPVKLAETVDSELCAEIKQKISTTDCDCDCDRFNGERQVKTLAINGASNPSGKHFEFEPPPAAMDALAAF